MREKIQISSDSAPYLNLWNDEPKFNYNWVDNANPNYGSVVAIVSQEFLIYLSQPPAILPISCRFRYALLFKS